MINNMKDFIINFSQNKDDPFKNTVSYPFKLIFKTNSNVIEKECKKQWPQLMEPHPNSVEDNIDLFKMGQYIKKCLSGNDIKDIHNVFYTQGWMDPCVIDHNITKIELTRFNCRQWNDPQVPFLEIEGVITVDLLKLLSSYVKNKWIAISSEGGIASETILFRIKPFPLLLRYMAAGFPFAIILGQFQIILQDKNNYLTKEMQRIVRFTSIHTYDKEIQWGYDHQTITCKLNDTLRLLKDKVKRNPTAYGFAAGVVYNIVKNKK